jgi:hypothetical protein
MRFKGRSPLQQDTNLSVDFHHYWITSPDFLFCKYKCMLYCIIDNL